MSKLGSKTSKSTPTSIVVVEGSYQRKMSRKMKPSSTSGKMKKASDSSTPDEDSGEEVSEAKPSRNSGPTMKGIGLTPKLMVCITLVAILVTIVVGGSIASQIRKYVNNEILKSGIDGVQLFASFGRTLIDLNVEQKLSKKDFEPYQNVREFIEAIKIKMENAKFDELLKEKFDGLETPIMDGYITMVELKKRIRSSPSAVISPARQESFPIKLFVRALRVFPSPPQILKRME